VSARNSSPVLSRLVWFGRAARLALEDPVEGIDRALQRRHKRPPDVSEPDEAWESHLHALLGACWPCSMCTDLERIFADTIALLKARGLTVGRGAFGGWDDADPAFARAVWSLAVHLRSERVVETGVGRGVTTRVILEALRQRHAGHLWSIDRPPLDPLVHPEIGAAVPGCLRGRWTLLRGTSRRVLPGLLARIAPIDLFIHDSLHTERNLRFELTTAWASMDGGGALAADDVQRSSAFQRFVDTFSDLAAVIGPADDGRSCFGVALPGAIARASIPSP
jgi:hypothetical protein